MGVRGFAFSVFGPVMDDWLLPPQASSPIEVAAITRDENREQRGRVIGFVYHEATPSVV